MEPMESRTYDRSQLEALLQTPGIGQYHPAQPAPRIAGRWAGSKSDGDQAVLRPSHNVRLVFVSENAPVFAREPPEGTGGAGATAIASWKC